MGALSHCVLYYKVTLVLYIAKRMINGYMSLLVLHVHTVNGLFVCLFGINPLPPAQMPLEKHKVDASRNKLDSVFQEVHEPRHPQDDKREGSMTRKARTSVVSKCVGRLTRRTRLNSGMSDWLGSQHHLPDADF